jgi:hypothetical protein
MISDVLAAPQATLDQGPGAAGVARIVAGEWQRDGYLKPGKIAAPQKTGLKPAPTQSKGCGTRGVSRFQSLQ